jgi:hypothetical protein
MELSFVDSDEVPVPPELVRIHALRVEPYPDGKRIALDLSLTPFLEAPDLAIRIQNQDDVVVASTDVIEARDPKMRLTIHIRGPVTTDSLKAVVDVHYQEQGQVDKKDVTFDLLDRSSEEGA